MTASPRVSVLMPVYNAMPWLPVAAESVLAQTFTDFELLLVDDGSTDGSGEACDAIAARDARVRVLRHARGVNRGIIESLNLGLPEARGEYVARLDADDMMYPERLERQVQYLDAHPEIALLGNQFDFGNPDGATRSAVPTEPSLVRWTLLFENCFMGGGATFRTDAAHAVGGVDPAFDTVDDYDLWERLTADYAAANLPETLGWYNQLRTQRISTLQAQKQMACALSVAERSIRRYVPDAESDAVARLFETVGWHTQVTPSRMSLRSRSSAAIDLLDQLWSAFVARHPTPAPALQQIQQDRDRRLALLRRDVSWVRHARRFAHRMRTSTSQ